MRNASPEVLVVGAGPVGLTMAAELARNGISCRIIDRIPNPLPYCRAIGITPRTLEVWDDMGIADPLIDAGLWIVGTRSFLNHSPAQDVQNELFGLPYGHLGIPQPETERILAEHLATFGIAVERPVTLTSLKQDSQQVQVELLHSDNSNETAVFRYVVGCDGAHSAVRRLSEIQFEGDHFPFTFMLGDVVLDCNLPRGMVLRSIRPNENGVPDFLVAIPAAGAKPILGFQCRLQTRSLSKPKPPAPTRITACRRNSRVLHLRNCRWSRTDCSRKSYRCPICAGLLSFASACVWPRAIDKGEHLLRETPRIFIHQPAARA